MVKIECEREDPCGSRSSSSGVVVVVVVVVVVAAIKKELCKPKSYTFLI